MVAKEAATLDVLTGGRFELGIGAGWMTTDYQAAGIALDRPGRRIDRLTEAVAVLRGLWGDGPLTFTGDHYPWTGSTARPRRPPRAAEARDRRRRRTDAAPGRPSRPTSWRLNVNLHAGVIDERAFPDGTAGVDGAQAGLDPARPPVTASTASSSRPGSTWPWSTDDRDRASRSWRLPSG